MKTNIVSVKYEDQYVPRTFSGRQYAYFSKIDLQVGDLVEAPTKYGTSIAKVCEIDIPEQDIQDHVKKIMRVITTKIDSNRFFNYYQVQKVA